MGGFFNDEDWKMAKSSNEVRNIVLVRRTGNDKSATANSIISEKAFASKLISYGVTTTCQMQQTTLKNGQKLNIIDTPGLFYFSLDTCYVGKEIVNCIRMAKMGIHVVVFVFSVLIRFFEEEKACLQCLQSFFGSKLVDYMIVVFTGGDELEDDDQMLDDYIGKECPKKRHVILGSGNGKSATDNIILGRKAFKSSLRSSGVTATSDLQTTTLLSNSQVLNVIDTPGLFHFAVEASFVSKEMINCARLAKDGIHAFIVVFSIRTRFTKEEYTTIKSLQSFFGIKLVDYMIIVFTRGDELEDNEQSLEDYISSQCPEPIKEIVRLCKHRKVLFNNKANESQREEQVQQLLTFVDMITKNNGGQCWG